MNPQEANEIAERLKNKNKPKKKSIPNDEILWDNLLKLCPRRLITGVTGAKKEFMRLPAAKKVAVVDAMKLYAAAYAMAPEGKARYFWRLPTWFRDGHYDDDPMIWNDMAGTITASSAEEWNAAGNTELPTIVLDQTEELPEES